MYHICLCITYVPGACGGQKRALDTLNMEFQTPVTHPYGYWDSNLGTLEEQPMLLTDETFL